MKNCDHPSEMGMSHEAFRATYHQTARHLVVLKTIQQINLELRILELRASNTPIIRRQADHVNVAVRRALSAADTQLAVAASCANWINSWKIVDADNKLCNPAALDACSNA